MARPTKYAKQICLGLTLLAALGIVIGLITTNALVIVLALAPAVAYEAYRTEGESTRWASWALAAVLVAEFLLLVFKVDFDVAEFLGSAEREVAGYQVPLGDIKVVGPALMIVLSLILITRTRGIYTRWLAAIILVTCFAIVYVLAPDVFPDLVRKGIEQAPQ